VRIKPSLGEEGSVNLEIAPPPDVQGQTFPLTERVLGRLGRPRLLWIVLWSLDALISPVVFANAIVLSGHTIAPSDRVESVTIQGVLAFACFVLLVGTGVLTNQAPAARDSLARLVRREVQTGLFRRIGSVRGPLILTTAVAATTSTGGWARYGPIPPLASLPLLVIYLVPILTFVWVYLTILADLDHLGRQPLALDAFPEDRTLGLERLGSLASAGLGFLLVAAVPLMLVAASEPVTLGISLVIVATTAAIFVLSMSRLHRQMWAAKERYVAAARRLYADAYAPLRKRANVETLEGQSSALRAAQSLDVRAQSLLTWPIDEGTLRFIAVVITGVVTSVIVRGLFAAVGF
jgi:hypothetical protein